MYACNKLFLETDFENIYIGAEKHKLIILMIKTL